MATTQYGGGGGGILVDGDGPGSDDCTGQGWGGGACVTLGEEGCLATSPQPGLVLLEFYVVEDLDPTNPPIF